MLTAEIATFITNTTSNPYMFLFIVNVAILLLGMFHAMTENYLIAIFERLGGGSSNVGVALFIPTVVEAVVMVYFSRIRQKISDNWLLRWAGVTFLVKSFVFLFAPNIGVIYAAQVLQATSYGFLSPTQMYYADAKVHRSDMVKGQAFITAAYTLGCAFGNFLGGQILSEFGIAYNRQGVGNNRNVKGMLL